MLLDMFCITVSSPQALASLSIQPVANFDTLHPDRVSAQPLLSTPSSLLSCPDPPALPRLRPWCGRARSGTNTLQQGQALTLTATLTFKCRYSPLIYGNDVDSVDVATRVAMVGA